jgi:hypothetical protein
MTLRARIHRLERTLQPEQRLHIIELPARLAGDEAAIEPRWPPRTSSDGRAT